MPASLLANSSALALPLNRDSKAACEGRLRFETPLHHAHRLAHSVPDVNLFTSTLSSELDSCTDERSCVGWGIMSVVRRSPQGV